MDVAGVVIGSMALFLALFSSTVAGFQLQHYVRFRKPVFTVKEAQLPVRIRQSQAFLGPGDIVLNIRGAMHPVTLNKWEMIFFMGRIKIGSGGEVRPTTLEPHVWTLVPIRLDSGIALQDGPRASLQAEIYFTNPRDVFIIPLQLKLVEDGSRYALDDAGEWVRYLYRTIWRRRRIRRWLKESVRAMFPTRR